MSSSSIPLRAESMRLSAISCRLLTSIVSGPLPVGSVNDKWSLAKAQEAAKPNPIIMAAVDLIAALIRLSLGTATAVNSFNVRHVPAVLAILLLI